MIDFSVGEEVVCVDAKNTTNLGKQELVEGKVYKIRWIGPYYERRTRQEIICVRLVGLFRGMYKSASGNVPREVIEAFLCQLGLEPDHEDDPPFRAERFRSLEKTSSKGSIKQKERV